MKFKTTKKAIENGYYYRMGIGYCAAQDLLKYEEPTAYTCGAYGWNCDIYDIDGVAISTGYRSFPRDAHMSYDYETLKEYNRKAQAISYNYSIPYEERKNQVNALLKEFINHCTR